MLAARVPGRFSWRHQLREFKSEFRVVAVDMRGYGESDLPPSTECYRLDYLVTDVKDIVEYLGERNELCFISLLLFPFFFNPNSLKELIKS